jgi:hypothetical protein
MLTLAEKLRRFESEPDWLELPLPVDPGSSEQERVLVERLGPRRFLVLSTPGFVEGLAADDTIETVEDAVGFRVLRRGGNVAVRFAVASDVDVELARAFLDSNVGPLGGQLDGTMGVRGMTYTVPYSSTFARIEAIMTGALSRFHDSAWWYGNVYDSENRPLGWWHVA